MLQKAGHLSLAAPDAGVINLNITTAGYPGDKTSGTMWQSKCSGVQFDFTGAGFKNGGTCGTEVRSCGCMMTREQHGIQDLDMHLGSAAIWQYKRMHSHGCILPCIVAENGQQILAAMVALPCIL